MEINVIDMTGDTPKQTTLTMPNLPAWTMAAEIGYTPKTTFWQDFSIADLYGAPDSIVDTFNRAFNGWRDNVVYIAEMSLVLNHKGCWYHSVSEQHGNDPILKALSELYFELWEKLHDWAKRYYKGDDAQYYFDVTD